MFKELFEANEKVEKVELYISPSQYPKQTTISDFTKKFKKLIQTSEVSDYDEYTFTLSASKADINNIEKWCKSRYDPEQSSYDGKGKISAYWFKKTKEK
ncbi:MAG: hypothetical protein J7L15_04470 [Clostridiales bacterium]|nr:hypothetical protein [Clostridiales bacterium]